jgi:ADP-ribose pyrophosphatase YjhB (NUDIX family)
MSGREYPERPLIGVGGVVIAGDQVLLVRRGAEPLRGQWSIPGGLLEAGETLAAAVAREVMEETGLSVRVLDLIEALDRIFSDVEPRLVEGGMGRPRYHYVVLDYLCEIAEGEPQAGSDVTEAVFVHKNDLPRYSLSPDTLRVLHKGFAMARGDRTSGSKPAPIT